MTAGSKITGAAIAAVLALTAPAAAAEPIEGEWQNQEPGAGRVLVEATSAGKFKGTVTRPHGGCQQVGDVIWQLEGAGTTYSGTVQFYDLSNCAKAGLGRGTWAVSSDAQGQLINFCFAQPGAGEPDGSQCVQFRRPSDPDPGDGGGSCAPGAAEATICNLRVLPKTAFAKGTNATIEWDLSQVAEIRIDFERWTKGIERRDGEGTCANKSDRAERRAIKRRTHRSCFYWHRVFRSQMNWNKGSNVEDVPSKVTGKAAKYRVLLLPVGTDNLAKKSFRVR